MDGACAGKDRTALELVKSLADEAVVAGAVPPSGRALVEHRLARGLSYLVTSHNNGQPPAYAFSEVELMALPDGWRPDWKLCGKVPS